MYDAIYFKTLEKFEDHNNNKFDSLSQLSLYFLSEYAYVADLDTCLVMYSIYGYMSLRIEITPDICNMASML